MSDCEPLRGKKKARKFADLTVIECVDLSQLKSAVKFYKKYRDDDWCKELGHLWKGKVQGNMRWNEWLFDYCFGDAIE